MSRPLVVYGASELARDLVSVIEALEESEDPVRFLGFVDDDPAKAGTTALGYPVLGGGSWLDGRAGDVEVVLGIGAPRVRRALAGRLGAAGHAWGTLVHPTAVRTRSVAWGAGCSVMAHCTFTVDVDIGRHAVFNPGCTVAHDVRVGDYVYVSPGVDLAGAVQLHEGAFLGTGAVVLPHRTVGCGAVVGAGAVVTRDVPPDTVVTGVPARALRTSEPSWNRAEDV